MQGFKVNVKQKAEFEWLGQVGQTGGMEVWRWKNDIKKEIQGEC